MKNKSVIECDLKYQGPIQPSSLLEECPEHPEEDFPNSYEIGFGFDGGGYGHYRKCKLCKRVFAKVDMAE